ncbi:MAG: AAA family ATPase [Silvanigrellaceae bacterium]|nr:AAA family ATPase [Silvanigrellaceae bacterium]
MILNNFSIKNYKSIIEINNVNVDTITCLVGKNESGKTSLLEAITKLNPINNLIGDFQLEEYPRNKYSEYKQQHDSNPAIVIKATFQFTDNDKEKLEKKFGKQILLSNEICVYKKYDNTLNFDFDVNESEHIKFLVSLEKGASDIKEILNSKTFNEFELFLNSIEDPNNAIINLLKKTEYLKKYSIKKQISDFILSELLPKFFYFDEYSILSGIINLTELQSSVKNNKLQDSDLTALSLIKLSGSDLEDFLEPENYERLRAALESSSNYISDQIFEYWSQNKNLEVRFELEKKGKDCLLHIRVYNQKHRVTVPFDKRSKGFIWFFSFLVAFSDYRNQANNIILLLDEPGLNLHAKAQFDLLRFIENKLSIHHQVIYTTHSPFMIDPNHWERIRTVQDTERSGTKVSSNPLETDKDTLFPLQAALGYDIAQTLFIGTNNLIVEGPSDLIYLGLANSLLGNFGLDSRWAIIPVGGADKISTFVSLLGGSKLNIVTFIDIDTKEKQRINNLIENGLLKNSNLITVGMILENRQNADIEDLFDEEEYLKIVSNAYKDELNNKLIRKSDLKQNNTRITKKIESYFKENEINNGRFNHFKPAECPPNKCILQTQ